METLQRLHNRGSISTGYDVDYSCKFEHDNAESLSRGQAQGSQQTWTFSTWIKRTQLSENSNEPYQNIWSAGSSTSNATHVYFRGDSSYPDNKLFFYMDNGGSQFWHGQTPQSFRDTSAWYHLVWAVDTTQATASNRSKIYINGEQITLDNVTYPNQNASTRVMDNGGDMYIGALAGNGGYRFNGYLAETVLIDGTQLAASDFGEFDSDTGIWKPIDVSGLSFGTRGFYLDYSDAANLGNDADGSTVFTENYLASADQATDTPTNNFATINILQSNSSKLIISNGATDIVKSGNYGWQTTTATMAVREGKWYAEFKLDTSCDLVMLGVNQIEDEVAWNGSHIGAYSNSTARGMGYYSSNGNFYRNGGSGAIGSSYLAGDIIGIALLINANGTGFMGMHKNGTWQNSQDPSSGTTGMLGLEYGNPIESGIHYTFAISTHQDAGGVLANFGGFPGFTISSGNSDANGYGNFEYTVPTGYYALCTKNLEEFA